MRLLIAMVLIAPMLSGCVLPGQDIIGTPGASHWSWTRDDSMLPNFAHDGPSYPVMAIHYHAGVSKRTEEEWKRNPVVCMDQEDNSLPIFKRDMAQACGPPTSDPATGRLFMPREQFDAWNPSAIVVQPDPCGGSIQAVGQDGAFTLPTVEHEFDIQFRDGRFIIDDDHILSPGQTLKATYWADYGDHMDQRFIRVVFDYPGEWLLSQVGEHDFEGAPRITSATLDENGNVLNRTLPWSVSSWDDIIPGLTPAENDTHDNLVAMRMATSGGKLTELFASTIDEWGVTDWYLASRDGDQVKLLGERRQEHAESVKPSEFLAAFPDSLTLYGGNASVKRIEWVPTLGFDSTGLLPVPEAWCADCVRIWSDHPLAGPGWRATPEANPRDGIGSMTLLATTYASDGSEATTVYHNPMG